MPNSRALVAATPRILPPKKSLSIFLLSCQCKVTIIKSQPYNDHKLIHSLIKKYKNNTAHAFNESFVRDDSAIRICHLE